MTNGERTADSIETRSNRPWTTRQRLVALGLAVLGLALAATGVRAVFTTDNDTGAAALLTVGTILVLFAAFGNRLKSLRYGDLELALRDEADEAKRRGDVEAAEVLERAADTVGQRVARAAHWYKTVRGSMPAGPERTMMMDRIIDEIERDAKDAKEADLDQEEILRLIWTGSVGARVWALGTLKGQPRLATTRAVLEAVQRPDEMFDQYHALVLAERFVALPETRPWARKRIADVVRELLESGALGEDDPSKKAAKRVLDQVDKRAK